MWISGDPKVQQGAMLKLLRLRELDEVLGPARRGAARRAVGDPVVDNGCLCSRSVIGQIADRHLILRSPG